MGDLMARERYGMPSTRAPFMAGAESHTRLPFLEEMAFRQWLRDNNVRFNPDVPSSDYDMRGFWQATQRGDPLAASAVNPNDQRMHYPDYWKTPEHHTFSSESQWATPETPSWMGDKLVSPYGRVMFDEAAPPDYPWEQR